ncbi:histidine phosphatase family protein [Pseudomonadota bacterium]
MDIFLVRHGEAAASWAKAPDPGLSELGREQARAAAQALQSRLSGQVQLQSSPLARARDTAEPLAAALALPVEVNEAFREIRAPVPLEQRQAWLREFMQQRWDQQSPDLHDWRSQAVNELLQLSSSAVVYTHFLLINAVVGQILGEQNTLHFWPENGSITHLRRGERGLELVELGAQMPSVIN